MKYLGYSELTKRLYVPKRSSIPHGKIDITDDVAEYINMLKQSENVQASVATGDGGNKCNPHGHNLDVRYQSVCSNCGGTQLADADNRFVASNQTPVKECYVPVSVEDERVPIGKKVFVSYDGVEFEGYAIGDDRPLELVIYSHWLKKVTLPVTDSGSFNYGYNEQKMDWEKLEEKFFKEFCLRNAYGNDMRNTVWNWIKSNIK